MYERKFECNEGTDDWMNEWMNECIDEWINL